MPCTSVLLQVERTIQPGNFFETACFNNKIECSGNKENHTNANIAFAVINARYAKKLYREPFIGCCNIHVVLQKYFYVLPEKSQKSHKTYPINLKSILTRYSFYKEMGK